VEGALIQATDLSFGYESNRNVFEEVTFSLSPGRLYALMGGNGSGKTTILKCLSGLLRGYTGDIRLAGVPLPGLGRKELARKISLVPQESSIIFPYPVRNMVLMGRAPYIGTFDLPGKNDQAIAEEALQTVGIPHLADKLYAKISGGERQLVLIARALAQKTPVMILDEPTSHLDFRNQTLIFTILGQLVREHGLLVITAIHDPNLALSFCDEVMILHQGRILLSGPPCEVINRKTISRVYSVEVEEIRHNGRIRGIMPAGCVQNTRERPT
jgi:iron complex transport system ATP-binding protein